jgi:hypothetical protein
VALAGFCVQDNALFFRQYLRTQQDISLATRIATRLESQPDFRPDLPLVIIGDIETVDFHKENKSNREIVVEYLRYCSLRSYSVGRSAFAAPWSKYHIFFNFLEFPARWPTAKQQTLAQELAAGCEPFPAPDSVFIHDDLAVVVLSN